MSVWDMTLMVDLSTTPLGYLPECAASDADLFFGQTSSELTELERQEIKAAIEELKKKLRTAAEQATSGLRAGEEKDGKAKTAASKVAEEYNKISEESDATHPRWRFTVHTDIEVISSEEVLGYWP